MVASVAFHGLIAAAVLISFRNFRVPEESHAVPVDLVTIAEQTNVAAQAPPKPPLVRMISENITMKWTPMGKEKTMLEAEGTIDIGGDVPNWAINALQRQAPYTTIVGLQRFLATPASKDVGKTLPFTIFGE